VDQPVITSVTESPNSIQLEVSGANGVPLTLEASSNFQDWAPVDTGAPVGGKVTFTETISSATQFYRIKVQ